MSNGNGVCEEWGVYEVEEDGVTVQVHVIPHHEDVPHATTPFCLCDPEYRYCGETGIEVYVHAAVYYN